MSIADAFEALPCVKCGTPRYKGCGCWIKLKCTGCGKEKSAELDPTDPPGTAVVKTRCPECAKGDRSLIDYYDKDGRQIDHDGKPMSRPDRKTNG